MGLASTLGAVTRGYHATPRAWSRPLGLGPLRPDFRRGEGFGLHFGTEEAVNDIEAGFDDGLLARMGQRRYEVETTPQREIAFPDLGHWRPNALDYEYRDAPEWAQTNLHMIEGLTLEEHSALREAVRGAHWSAPQSQTRDALRALGVDQLRYVNANEGIGSISRVALDPDIVRVRDPMEARRRALALAAAGGATGVGGGLMAALYGSEPRTP